MDVGEIFALNVEEMRYSECMPDEKDSCEGWARKRSLAAIDMAAHVLHLGARWQCGDEEGKVWECEEVDGR